MRSVILEVTGASISDSGVTVDGNMITAEHPMTLKHGDQMKLEVNASTGEFKHMLQGGGKDNI